MTKRIHAYKWATIGATIEAVAKDAGKLQDKIHAVAISILSEWARSPKVAAEAAMHLTNLQNASPYHAQAFSDWVALVSGLNWSEEKECWYAQKGQKFSKAQLDYAKANPFWVVSKPKKARPALTNEGLLAMLERILKAQEKADKKPVEGDHFSPIANKHIREAMTALNEAIKVEELAALDATEEA